MGAPASVRRRGPPAPAPLRQGALLHLQEASPDVLCVAILEVFRGEPDVLRAVVPWMRIWANGDDLWDRMYAPDGPIEQMLRDRQGARTDSSNRVKYWDLFCGVSIGQNFAPDN